MEGMDMGSYVPEEDWYTSPSICLLYTSIENKLYDGRIMRPATKYVGDNMDYVAMEDR